MDDDNNLDNFANNAVSDENNVPEAPNAVGLSAECNPTLPLDAFKRRDRDNDEDDDNADDSNVQAAAAAAFGADRDPLSPLDTERRRYHDDEEEKEHLDKTCRQRRFVSTTSSSCESPFRSCKSSLSPQNSSGSFDPHLPSERGESASGDDEGSEVYYSDEEEETNGNSTTSAVKTNDNSTTPAVKTTDNSTTSAVKTIDNSSALEEEEEEEETSGHLGYDFYSDQFEGWKGLPCILLEDILVLLSPKQRHQASMVCRPWYEMFYSPRVWETFVLFERTLTRRRFNLYKGYQRELCPRKTQICLMRVGCFFKRIVITPISDYYNLYEFLRVLSSFLTYYPDFPMPLLHTFRFTFACESRGVNGISIIGTGGNILDKLKDLVSNMQQLRHVALNELLLDVEEVPGLLAAAAKHCSQSLLSLELLNCSKVPLPMCEVTQFSQLLKLTLSPQHLSEEVVLLLGGTQLLHLHIVQDAYTCFCQPVSGEAWKLFKDMAPGKRVFLEVQGLTKTPLLLQPHAPVRGVIFRTPYHRLQPELATWLVEYYGKTLEYFVQERLPRAHGSRRFSERADESFLRLVRACPRLHTLVIRERISLATLLLLAGEGKGLKTLVVRRNALIKKCEWPRAGNWSQDFHEWLRRNGKDYDLAFRQVPVMLRQRWRPALDRAFKHLKIQVT